MEFGCDPGYQYAQGAFWPGVSMGHNMQMPHDETGFHHSTAPPQSQTFPYNHTTNTARHILTSEWAHAMQQHPHHAYVNGNTNGQQYAQTMAAPLQQSPVMYGPHSQAPMHSGLSMASSHGSCMVPYTSPIHPFSYYANDMHNGWMGGHGQQSLHQSPFNHTGLIGASPTDTLIESQSPTSSDSGWHVVDREPHEPFGEVPHSEAMSDSTITLHARTTSDPSQSNTPRSGPSIARFEDARHALRSVPPTSIDQRVSYPSSYHALSHQRIAEYDYSQASSVHPSSATSSPPQSPGSPIERPSSPQRKDKASKKISKTPIKKFGPIPPPKKTGSGEKRVGKRSGPLRPEARKQAGEIRKLKACLRCRFLKKTCDTGDLCAGCQPSHARLWQVPCTRLNIHEIGYFTKDWKGDYERQSTVHQDLSKRIQGYSSLEQPYWVTHGFGVVLSVRAREVYVSDPVSFTVDWAEAMHVRPQTFETPTASLSPGPNGVSMSELSSYVDSHIDGNFNQFVKDYFEGTTFLTDLLLTVYNYYRRTKYPVIRKALKLVVAYNLSMHIMMIEGLSDADHLLGKVADENSKNFGKTVAPVMINFQIKQGLAKMWRDLMKDVLMELSVLYTGCYTGDKLKNWATIFMLDSLLLAVWEEMQFDEIYFTGDRGASVAESKFCLEMEGIPVGVIVGLFTAISQKMPAITEWDTEKHAHVLHSEPAACRVMTELREHVRNHEDYLNHRSDCKFDADNFDSLSNKFISRLVVRNN